MAEQIFARRSELLRKFQVPMKVETSANLGESLSEVIMSTMTPIAQELMGVSKPLSTVPKDAIISPQDRLQGNIVVRPPPVVECLQAFSHEKIMEIGYEIEMKMMHEREALIQNAIQETQQFEQFECSNRVKFAVEQEHNLQMIERKWERNELLSMFQEEREQLLETHAVAMEALTTSLTTQCKQESDKRVAKIVAEADRKSLESELKYKLEISLLNECLNKAQDRQNEALNLQHENYMEIFKQLYKSFLTELQEQRNEMFCAHIAEMMHIVSVEKKLTDAAIFDKELDFQSNLEQLKAQIVELEKRPSHTSIKTTSPRTKKLEILFASILKQYSDFVEHTLREIPNQGKFLVPTQKYLQQVLEDDSNVKTVLDCFLSRERNVENHEIVTEQEDGRYGEEEVEGDGEGGNICLNFTPTPRNAPTPLLLASCTIRPKPKSPRPLTPPSEHSSSLSCFDFSGTVYASNKHYDRIIHGMNEEVNCAPDMLWNEDSHILSAVNFAETNEQPSTSEETLTQKFDDKVNTFCEKLLGLLHDPKMAAANPECQDEIIKSHVIEFARTVCKDVCTMQPNQNVPFMSRLLSTADSLELITGVRHSNIYSSLNTSEEKQHNGSISSNDSSFHIIKPINRKAKVPPACVPLVDNNDKDSPPAPPKSLDISVEEYVRSFQKIPSYMKTSNTQLHKPKPSLWNYKVTTPNDWNHLLNSISEDTHNAHTDKRVCVSEYVSKDPPKSNRSSLTSSLPQKAKKILRNHHNFVDVSEVTSKVPTLNNRLKRDAAISNLMNQNYK